MPPSPLKALLWDVDGTLAETERDGHRVAFNLAFEAFGLPWHWDDSWYGELLRVTGGRERLLHDMQGRPDAPSSTEERDTLARVLHARKNELYAQLVSGIGIPLRDGVLELMGDCRDYPVRMAIATTTSKSNLDALMRQHLGRRWIDHFEAIVCGEDVERKKPDPEVFFKALQALDVDASEVIAIEDSPSGVAAARAAGCAVIVTRSVYFAHAKIEGAIAIGPGFHTRAGWRPALDAAHERTMSRRQRVHLADLIGWFARRDELCDS